jgi:hypothetical protein
MSRTFHLINYANIIAIALDCTEDERMNIKTQDWSTSSFRSNKSSFVESLDYQVQQIHDYVQSMCITHQL